MTVPGVAGLPVRAAALALHRKGLEVNVRGTGIVAQSIPAAGASVAPGAVVQLIVE